jgi:2,3-bisphosphoglycerate-independent phosphoglycerate mutase
MSSSSAAPKKPVVLIIRDGWGINPGGKSQAQTNGDATLLAHTPFHDHLYANYPWAQVSGSGEDVGLPAGQMGNSEVGHLNLGAGRVVYQDLTRINKAIRENTLGTNTVLQEAFAAAKGKRLHLLGLISDGGVHSHQDHLAALCQLAQSAGCADVMVHAITDGRDTSPTAGAGYMAKLESDISSTGAKIATVIGRYYAMDRDKRWERNKLAWDAIVFGKGEARSDTPSAAVKATYTTEPRGDEFLLPMIFSHGNEQRIRDGDVVLWFNFRADRARQLSDAFLKAGFDGFDREVTPKVSYYTLTEYDATYYDLGCKVIFNSESMSNNLGQVIAAAGLTQLRAAETEKYPHVTFFFNSGVEEPNAGEDRYLAISPKEVPTYDKKPQMSAPDLTFEVLRRLPQYDAVIINFANPDMVGHTGIIPAGVHACETIDFGVRLIVERVLELGGKLFITADHGNCEQMQNADGSPHTAHTTNLVHGIYVAADAASMRVRDGILADVAPTLLDMLGVAQPAEMTGRSLLEKV